ncbi:substrate-binding domain-containing protein [Streptomyces coelicoflavus]|uniref:substrate-binding domain-containing protein n=1 Tax=Streptomyces coelicoflavus TaxID=285562 RepID=UPI0034503648
MPRATRRSATWAGPAPSASACSPGPSPTPTRRTASACTGSGASAGQAPAIGTPAVTEDPVEAAVRMLSAADRPDAVHGLNETYGQALVVAARRLGLAVPGDLVISVMRESDQTLGAADWEVPLTALSLDARRLGAECVSALIDVLDGEEPDDVVVPCTVVVRGSTRRSVTAEYFRTGLPERGRPHAAPRRPPRLARRRAGVSRGSRAHAGARRTAGPRRGRWTGRSPVPRQSRNRGPRSPGARAGR